MWVVSAVSWAFSAAPCSACASAWCTNLKSIYWDVTQKFTKCCHYTIWYLYLSFYYGAWLPSSNCSNFLEVCWIFCYFQQSVWLAYHWAV
jgi:hypothetical protein